MKKLWLVIFCTIIPMSFASTTVNNKNHKTEQIARHLAELDDNYSFKEQTRIVLPNGEVRVKHQQYYKGVPVWGASIITAGKEKEDL